jgi:hypothetical protein
MALDEQEVMLASKRATKSAAVPAELGRCVRFDDRDKLDATNFRVESFALLYVLSICRWSRHGEALYERGMPFWISRKVEHLPDIQHRYLANIEQPTHDSADIFRRRRDFRFDSNLCHC